MSSLMTDGSSSSNVDAGAVPSTSSRASGSSAVQVAVRVRPLSASESAQASESCVHTVGASTVVLGDKQYDFDAAFAPHVEQQHVYEQLVAPLVERFFDGYNATVFAYGQTGSGKTFTMGNEFKLDAAPLDRGIIPRAMDAIFERVHGAPEHARVVVKVSYLEILNEEIYDLLSASPTAAQGLTVRDEGKRGIVVAGLSEHSVASLAHVAALLQTGAQQRATASTTMNAHSSRSHAICTLTMEQHDARNGETRLSKFHLVDLAGSERAKRTNAQGARFREGVNINRGLLALGNVINALCDRSRASGSSGATTQAAAAATSAPHVPYRDSKLTRLLQDSLGGNSKTVMIACVSPADVNFDETSSTLRYASRARSIENRAVVNKELSAATEVASLKQQLAVLQLQMLQQQQQSVPRPLRSGNASSDLDVAALETELATWKDLAQTREAELKLVAQAKDKWKRVANEFLASSAKSTLSVSANGAASSTAALAHEALAFEDSIATKLTATAAVDPAALPEQQQQLQADLDSLSDVIAVKEKIMRALAAQSSAPETDALLASLAASHEHTVKQLEQRVSALEADETTEPRQSLEGVGSSGDLASATADPTPGADVRAQLETLLMQLQVAKRTERECKKLAALWRSGTFKLSTLELELVEMKKQRVDLQRKLRDASESHRRAARALELQVLQLTREDARKRLELQKLTALHAKQHNALKRKTEEVALANKRARTMAMAQHRSGRAAASPLVKSAEHQPSSALCAPGSSSKTPLSDSLDSVARALERTVDVELTVLGAKRAIAMDLDERRRIARELAALEARPSTDDSSAQVATLREALQRKNAAIRVLQQKLASVERSSSAVPSELLPASAAACHQVIRSLLDAAVESRAACAELERSARDVDALEQQLTAQADAYERTIAELKRELQDAAAQSKARSKAKTPRAPLTIADMDDEIVSSSASDDVSASDGSDSDYVEPESRASTRRSTSAAKRRVSIVVAQQQQHVVQSTGDGSVDVMAEIDALLALPSRADVPLCCACSGKCATRACACKAERQTCGASCACSATKCLNRSSSSSSRSGADTVPNASTSTATAQREEDDETEAEEGANANGGGPFVYVAPSAPPMSVASRARDDDDGAGDKENAAPVIVAAPATPVSKLEQLWLRTPSTQKAKRRRIGDGDAASPTPTTTAAGATATPKSLIKPPSRRFVLQSIVTPGRSSHRNTERSLAATRSGDDSASHVARFF